MTGLGGIALGLPRPVAFLPRGAGRGAGLIGRGAGPGGGRAAGRRPDGERAGRGERPRRERARGRARAAGARGGERGGAEGVGDAGRREEACDAGRDRGQATAARGAGRGGALPVGFVPAVLDRGGHLLGHADPVAIAGGRQLGRQAGAVPVGLPGARLMRGPGVRVPRDGLHLSILPAHSAPLPPASRRRRCARRAGRRSARA